MTGVPQKPSQTPPPIRSWYSPSGLWQRKTTVIAALSIAGILLHLVLRLGLRTAPGSYHLPLLATLVVGGLPLLYDLLRKLLKRESGPICLEEFRSSPPSCWANIWLDPSSC